MIDEKDKRIGILNTDGTVLKWPELNYGGGSYSQPASRHNVDATHFVVLPMNFTDWDALQTFKGISPRIPQFSGFSDANAVEEGSVSGAIQTVAPRKR